MCLSSLACLFYFNKCVFLGGRFCVFYRGSKCSQKLLKQMAWISNHPIICSIQNIKGMLKSVIFWNGNMLQVKRIWSLRFIFTWNLNTCPIRRDNKVIPLYLHVEPRIKVQVLSYTVTNNYKKMFFVFFPELQASVCSFLCEGYYCKLHYCHLICCWN